MSDMQQETIDILKLANGEEVIGKTHFEGSVVVVKDALLIITMQSGNSGQMQMGMIPYMPYAKEFILYSSSIIAIGVPSDELLESYKRNFSSIVLPPQQSIMTGV